MIENTVGEYTSQFCKQKRFEAGAAEIIIENF
jgi:hypothetical protein